MENILRYDFWLALRNDLSSVTWAVSEDLSSGSSAIKVICHDGGFPEQIAFD